MEEFAALPDTVLELVFGCFGYSMTEFRVLSLVCKRWHDLCHGNERLHKAMLCAFVAQSQWCARNIVVDNLVGAGDDRPLDVGGVDGPPTTRATADAPARPGPGTPLPGTLTVGQFVAAALQQLQAGRFDFGRYHPAGVLVLGGRGTWLQALQRFHCSFDNYVRVAKLGNERSSYYRARVITTNTFVSLKDLGDDDEAEGVSPRALREITILQQVRHPSILTPTRLLQAPSPAGTRRLFLSFPLVGPSLREVIFRMEGTLTCADVRRYMADLLAGLAYLHSRGIVRRTLQLDKLLLTPCRTHLMLNNFQHSRQFSRLLGAPLVPGSADESANVTASPPIAYNLCYCPPELLMGQKSDAHDWSVDSWHAGCMMAAMLKGEPLFFGDSKVGQMMQIFDVLGRPTEETWPGVSRLPDFPDFLPNFRPRSLQSVVKVDPAADADTKASLYDLLGRLLVMDPRRRLTPAEALHHPFLTGAPLAGYAPDLMAAPARARHSTLLAMPAPGASSTVWQSASSAVDASTDTPGVLTRSRAQAAATPGTRRTADAAGLGFDAVAADTRDAPPPRKHRRRMALKLSPSSSEGSDVEAEARDATTGAHLRVPLPFPGHEGAPTRQVGLPFPTMDPSTACCVAREAQGPVPQSLFAGLPPSACAPRPNAVAEDLAPLRSLGYGGAMAAAPGGLATVHMKPCGGGSHEPLTGSQRRALSWQLAQQVAWQDNVEGLAWMFDPSATLHKTPK